MKITLLTYGSRGDIQPFLALSEGLKKAGHDVRLAGPNRFAGLVESYGIPFTPLAGDPEEISARFNDAGQNPFRMVHAIYDYILEIALDVVSSILRACDGADCIVHSFLFTTGAHGIACEKGVPDISVQTFPMFAPTKAFPNVSVANIPGGWPSYLSHWIFDRVFRYGSQRGYSSIRKKAASLPLPRHLAWPFDESNLRPRTPLLFAFSKQVVQIPPEWKKQDHIHVPGYFFLDEPGYLPGARLQEFLEAGTRPVCITFGSMVNRKIGSIQEIIISALRNTGQRGIILSGWGNWGIPEESSNQLLVMESAPHEWLFPRCKLVIHHGGAGTTAAALKSGQPSMIIPLAGDQPFWASRVDPLGVGPHSIKLKKLSSKNLEDVILRAEEPELCARANKMGHELAMENGIEEAIGIIERYVVQFWEKQENCNLKKSKISYESLDK